MSSRRRDDDGEYGEVDGKVVVLYFSEMLYNAILFFFLPEVHCLLDFLSG